MMSQLYLWCFEETTEELLLNVQSINYNLEALLANNKIYIEHIHVNPDEFRKTGLYDLEGLFVRLDQAINRIPFISDGCIGNFNFLLFKADLAES